MVSRLEPHAQQREAMLLRSTEPPSVTVLSSPSERGTCGCDSGSRTALKRVALIALLVVHKLDASEAAHSQRGASHNKQAESRTSESSQGTSAWTRRMSRQGSVLGPKARLMRRDEKLWAGLGQGQRVNLLKVGKFGLALQRKEERGERGTGLASPGGA